MRWLPRLAAGAAVAVVLAVGLALLLAEGPKRSDRAAVTHHSHPVATHPSHTVATHPSHTAATEGSGPAPTSGHHHDIDPVSAGLLLADVITVLAVVVLLLRRPRRSAPVRS